MRNPKLALVLGCFPQQREEPRGLPAYLPACLSPRLSSVFAPEYFFVDAAGLLILPSISVAASCRQRHQQHHKTNQPDACLP